MSKTLIDTNILVYSINEESDHFNTARDFISINKGNLYTTSKNISEFISVVTRLPKKPLDIEEAIKDVL